MDVTRAELRESGLPDDGAKARRVSLTGGTWETPD